MYVCPSQAILYNINWQLFLACVYKVKLLNTCGSYLPFYFTTAVVTGPRVCTYWWWTRKKWLRLFHKMDLREPSLNDHAHTKCNIWHVLFFSVIMIILISVNFVLLLNILYLFYSIYMYCVLFLLLLLSDYFLLLFCFCLFFSKKVLYKAVGFILDWLNYGILLISRTSTSLPPTVN